MEMPYYLKRIYGIFYFVIQIYRKKTCRLEGDIHLNIILETIIGTLIDGIVELWVSFMKKRNTDYDRNSFKKVITMIISIILILGLLTLLLAIFFLIKYIFPNLFDVVFLDQCINIYKPYGINV